MFVFLFSPTVNSGMSRPPKTAQAKRVAPPAVPEVYRHSGSSFGSAGYGSSEDAGGFLVPPDTPSALSIRGKHALVILVHPNCTVFGFLFCISIDDRRSL